MLQTRAFIRDKSLHSYNLLFLSATIVAGEIAESECADSKKAPSWNHSQDGAFLLAIKDNPRLCRGEKIAYGEGQSRQEKVSELE